MASKRRLRRKACGNKQRFATQDAAIAALRALTRSRGWHGYMAPYRCSFCGGFHYGHPPQHVRQAIGGGRG